LDSLRFVSLTTLSLIFPSLSTQAFLSRNLQGKEKTELYRVKKQGKLKKGKKQSILFSLTFFLGFSYMGSCKEKKEEPAKCVWVNGPIIVGAGPSGLAASACLSEHGVPSVILERSNCIASLWQHKTYDRLKLHLPKQFCALPLLGFPENFPKYPTKDQFISYMEAYASHFSIHPQFNQAVQSAEFDSSCGFWRVWTQDLEYISQWFIVATGENAEPVIPEIVGMERFHGHVVHTSAYKSGSDFANQKVLVVGCGNSGMEVSLDLCRHNAVPHMVVRNTVSFFNPLQISFFFFVVDLSILQTFIIFLMNAKRTGACSSKRNVWLLNIWNSSGTSQMVSFKASRQAPAASL
jgi:hypothetical protein